MGPFAEVIPWFATKFKPFVPSLVFAQDGELGPLRCFGMIRRDPMMKIAYWLEIRSLRLRPILVNKQTVI